MLRYQAPTRMIKDLTVFDMAEIGTQRKATWIVADSKPGPLEAPAPAPSPESPNWQSGDLVVRAVLSGRSNGDTVPYRFQFPAGENSLNVGVDLAPTTVAETLTAYLAPHTMVVGLEGKSRWPKVRDNLDVPPTYLIPAEWADDVAPAYRFYTANPSLFDPAKAKQNTEQLWKLYAGKNPFLVMQSWRLLCGCQAATTENCADALAQHSGYLQSICMSIVFDTWLNAHKSYQEWAIKFPTATEFLKLVARARTTRDLEAIISGLFTGSDAQGVDLQHKVVEAIIERRDQVTSGDPDRDAWLDWVLGSYHPKTPDR